MNENNDKPTDSFVSTAVLKANVDRTAAQMQHSRSWVIRKALDLGLSLLAQREANRLLDSIGVKVMEASDGTKSE